MTVSYTQLIPERNRPFGPLYFLHHTIHYDYGSVSDQDEFKKFLVRSSLTYLGPFNKVFRRITEVE